MEKLKKKRGERREIPAGGEEDNRRREGTRGKRKGGVGEGKKFRSDGK